MSESFGRTHEASKSPHLMQVQSAAFYVEVLTSCKFQGMDPDDAAKLYLERIDTRIPDFETMDESDLNYVKMINAGETLKINNVTFGYISHRIIFYLMNLHIKSRQTFFARAGTSSQEDSYKADAPLCSEGEAYAKKMGDALIRHREEERAASIAVGGSDAPLKPLTVWTSTRRRTVETSGYLGGLGYTVRQRSQMSQLNPGVCEKMSEEAILRLFPEEVQRHEIDPYHHRYPRAEVSLLLFARQFLLLHPTKQSQSYHDLAVRLEPIILELEREKNDLLIIAHESVLRVLYGYLMACDAMDIPKLSFPRNEIVEIIPASYQNEAKHITIPDLPEELIPSSPEGLKMPVLEDSHMGSAVSSGMVSPMEGLTTPVEEEDKVIKEGIPKAGE